MSGMLHQTPRHPTMCVCVVVSGSAQQHTHKWDACFRASIFSTRALCSGSSEFSSKKEKISACYLTRMPELVSDLLDAANENKKKQQLQQKLATAGATAVGAGMSS